jgi:hypothetical protein
MTSTNQTSSGAKANLVSSSPELLTRPAPKPDDRTISSTGELCTSGATALPSPRGEGHGQGVLPQPRHAHSLFTPDFPTRNEFLKLNLAAIFSLQPLALSLSVHSRSCLISSPGGQDQDEGVRSFDPHQTLDFPTRNAFLKLNLAAIFRRQPFAVSPQSSAFALHLSSQGRYVATSPCRPEPLVVRFAEILLRFAETSQQRLRQISLLPTTYINFPGKNALKLKKLRDLTHTTIVDSNSLRPMHKKVTKRTRTRDPWRPRVNIFIR